MPLRRTPVLLATAVTVAMLLAGCASEEEGNQAAEPQRAPEPATAPAGEVREVAPAPQGIVYDAATDSLAVTVRDSFRLLVLDPETLEQRLEVVLPGKARHLQVSAEGGTALVPSESADSLFEVDLLRGEVVETKVQDYPHDATGADNGDVLVANEFSGSISVVRDGEIVHTFDDLTQPGGVVAQDTTAAVVDVKDYSVTTYDLQDQVQIARVSGGEGPTHGVIAAPGKLAVTDTRGNRVRLYSLSPLKELGSIALEGGPYGIAGDPESNLVWVTLTGTNEVVGLDVSGDVPTVVDTYPTVRQPNTVAVAPGSGTIWVAGTAEGQIQRITR